MSASSERASRKVALCGIIGALSLACMFLSGLFPFAEYTCPALAGFCFIALVLEFGRKTALLAYLAAAVLTFFLVPNREAGILYIVFFGYYPIVKSLFEQFSSRIPEWICKFAVFNAAVVGAYLLLIRLFGMSELLTEMGGSTRYGLLAFWIIGNFTFFIYDLAISRVAYFYERRIRPKIKF